MTIGAANLAHRDLGLEQVEATAPSGKLGHVRSLETHMVELQHSESGVTTVGAAGTCEDIADVGHVAPLARSERWGLLDADGFESPATATDGCPYPVTVDTHDFTTGNLAFDAVKREPVSGEHGHRCVLHADVIELQDEGIRYTAIGAGVRVEMRVDKRASLTSASTAGVMGLIPMQLAACSEVLAVAVATPPLTALGVPVEAGQRQISVAPPAVPMPQLELLRVSPHPRRVGCAE